jgi:hypothetical protein
MRKKNKKQCTHYFVHNYKKVKETVCAFCGKTRDYHDEVRSKE